MSRRGGYMKKDKSKVNWDQFSKSVEQVLGEDFWDEMNHMIPKRGPAYDMYETDTTVVIIVELPDLRSSEEITLKQHGTDLLLQGSLAYRYPVPKEELLHEERLNGKFKRKIRIPFHFTSDDIHTSYKNGLLIIYVNKPSTPEGIPITFHEDESS